MKNKDLCFAFVAGTAASLNANNMFVSIDGKKLYSYGTVIAQRLRNGVILINSTRYSVTSNRHQYYLMAAARASKTRENKKTVPLYTRDLRKILLNHFSGRRVPRPGLVHHHRRPEAPGTATAAASPSARPGDHSAGAHLKYKRLKINSCETVCNYTRLK